jgi:hypothetical protein
VSLPDQLHHKAGSISAWKPRMPAKYKEEHFGCQVPAQFQLAGLSSHVEFELMPSFRITHDGSRIVGKQDVIRFLPVCPSLGSWRIIAKRLAILDCSRNTEARHGCLLSQ